MVYTEKDYLMHYGRKGMKWYQHIFEKDKSQEPSNLVSRNDFDKMKKYNMVIVGEIHNNDMIDYYDKLLSAKKPEYFICEFADTDRCFTKKELKDRMKNATNGATSGIGADYQYNYWAYELAYKHGCKLIGCNNPDFKKSSRMHDEDAARERYMLDVLKEFQGKNAVVQLGDHHLRSIPIDQGFLNYTGDTKDDRGLVSDLTVDNASPIWEYFKNRSDTCISREPNEYRTELKYVKSHLKHSDELYHHGIKGQKWGVRRYRNKDGTRTELDKKRNKGAKWKSDLAYRELGLDIKPHKFISEMPLDDVDLTVKKGKKVYHVTPVEFKNLREGQDLYISATKKDRHTYRAYLSMMMRNKGFDKKSIRELSFELKKDLKSPSNNQQRKIFESAYNKNKNSFEADLKAYYEDRGKKRPKDSYEAFIKSLDKTGNSKKIFYDFMRKNGYNAVLDQHDVDHSWMFAQKPLIVMDALNTLSDMKVSEVDDNKIKKSLKKLGII